MLVRTTHSQKIPENRPLNNLLINIINYRVNWILVINRLLKLHNNATSMYLLILRTLKELQTSKLH
jgi:hypothetical protein